MLAPMLVFTEIILAFVETVLKWKADNEKPPAIINQNLPVDVFLFFSFFFYLSLRLESNVAPVAVRLNGLKIACR